MRALFSRANTENLLIGFEPLIAQISVCRGSIMKLSRRILLLTGLQAALTYLDIAEDEPRRTRPGDARVTNFNVESAQKTRRCKLVEDRFISSSDGSSQPFRYYVPAGKTQNVRPLLVFLHSWSADYRQYKGDWIEAA